MKLVKIFKGVAFVVVGMIMLAIKFYNINQTVVVEETGMIHNFSEPIFVSMYFKEFFEQNGLNLVVSLLFIAVGVLELIQVKGMKSNANNQ